MREEPSRTTSLRPLNPRSRNGRSAPPCGRKSEKNMDSTLINDIKALELGLALKKTYGITLSAESAEAREVFHSVKTLADYVAAHRN